MDDNKSTPGKSPGRWNRLADFRLDAMSGPAGSVGAIVVGLLFGLIILYISNPDKAIDGFLCILTGGLTRGGLRGVGQVLYFATPIIMTGLSVGFAFKTNLFNIGTPGQYILGAYAAVLVGVTGTGIPDSIHWVVALLAACVAGGLWAVLPGVLKAFLNVNEVISCIMMNYIGMYLVNYLIISNKSLYNQLTSRTMAVPAEANIPKMGLNQIFPNSSVNGGIIIALALAVLMYIILQKTKFGYELKACGFNRDASRYAGINEKRSVILSMVIAGGLAGIGGALFYLAGSGTYIDVVDVLAEAGFDGIPVALLGLSNPIGVVLAGIFIAYITVGGTYMQLYSFVPEIIDIIVSAIIYFSAFALIFRFLLQRIAGRKRGEAQ